MSTIKEKLALAALTIFLPMIGELIKEELKEVEETFNEKDPEHLKATVQSVYPGLKQLAKMAATTKTQIDDTAVGSFVKAIEEFAVEFNVDLPDFVPPVS